jgi:hypothetical protein
MQLVKRRPLCLADDCTDVVLVERVAGSFVTTGDFVPPQPAASSARLARIAATTTLREVTRRRLIPRVDHGWIKRL